MSILPLSKDPQPDEAEFNAFFPSKFSLSQFTSAKSDLDGADYPQPYTGTRRILVIGTDERYLKMENGTLFSTGNHPVETLVPMYHLHKAGFEFDIATVSGNPVKFEFWAMPKQDEAITGLHEAYLESFQAPLKLADVVVGLGPDSDYAAVFIPGGHGPLARLPFSDEVSAVIRWALDNDRHLISICHGPAAFLACTPKVDGEPFPLAGYSITAFPDSADRETPDLGYMPGQLAWHFGEKLKALGVTILNTEVDKSTHQDRKLLTGSSPFAANNLGKLAAETLLAEVADGLTMDGAALAGAATTVAAIEDGADEAAIHDTVRAFAAPLGYDRFVIYTAPPPGDGAVDRVLWIEGDWFGGGQEVSAATYLARCPVNRHVLETDRPFFWTKSGGADHETYRVVEHPHGTGLHGLQVPVFGHAGLTGAVSFGGRSVDSSTAARLALTLVGIAAFHAAERLAGPTGTAGVPRLSKREREVIRWIASGRRQADVALLLGLSERTIENHLRRIRNRLGATSTAQAVHLLMRAGELDT